MIKTLYTALTIAGSDSSGGAGIQADLKTFAAWGVYGMSAITAVTAQNTCGVNAVETLTPSMVAAQIDAVFSDIPVGAVKIGMMANAEIVQAISERLRHYQPTHIVLDPVMVSKSGSRLLDTAAVAAVKEQLFPLAEVITPNLPEAAALAGFKINDEADMCRAAQTLHHSGARYVLVKGGHLPGAAVDILYDGRTCRRFSAARLDMVHTHGTGCTYSSAIAAGLSRGLAVVEAVAQAKDYVTAAIAHGFKLGQGIGPTHHFYALYAKMGWL